LTTRTTIKSAILLFHPSFCTCASLTSSTVILSRKVVFQVPAYLYCAVQHLRDLNRRVEVILHAVPEKQLWILLSANNPRSAAYFHLAEKRAALALFMADLPTCLYR